MTAPELDLIAALETSLTNLGRSLPSRVEPKWDGGFIGPDVDLFVSEADAAHRQRAVDAWLGETWGVVA